MLEKQFVVCLRDSDRVATSQEGDYSVYCFKTLEGLYEDFLTVGQLSDLPVHDRS